jgi:hypothetical protein
VQRHLLAKSAPMTNAVAVTDHEHPDHQFGINRGIRRWNRYYARRARSSELREAPRPAFQFKREASRAPSPSACAFRKGIPQPILLDISQETLAEMIRTTRSRVSYFMNKFRKLGLISYNGKIEVHNSQLNAVLRAKPEIERDDTSSKV